MECKWLDTLNIPADFRNKVIKIGNKRVKVDAINLDTNTIYEFYGDYWHGNPKVYNSNDINMSNKITFGELYSRTINRERTIKNAGYKLITIWEDDFDGS